MNKFVSIRGMSRQQLVEHEHALASNLELLLNRLPEEGYQATLTLREIMATEKLLERVRAGLRLRTTMRTTVSVAELIKLAVAIDELIAGAFREELFRLSKSSEEYGGSEYWKGRREGLREAVTRIDKLVLGDESQAGDPLPDEGDMLHGQCGYYCDKCGEVHTDPRNEFQV